MSCGVVLAWASSAAMSASRVLPSRLVAHVGIRLLSKGRGFRPSRRCHSFSSSSMVAIPARKASFSSLVEVCQWRICTTGAWVACNCGAVLVWAGLCAAGAAPARGSGAHSRVRAGSKTSNDFFMVTSLYWHGCGPAQVHAVWVVCGALGMGAEWTTESAYENV